MDILRPGLERVKDIQDETQQLRALEREGVVVSLDNLMTFPFVRASVEDETLTLHGLWNDIATGGVENYDGATGKFIAI